MERRSTLLSLASFVALLAGCGSSPPPKPAHSADQVPANSEAEFRDVNEERKRRAEEAAVNTPPMAYVRGSTAAEPAEKAGPPENSGKPEKPGQPEKKPSKPSGPRATRAECERVVDKGIEIEISTNPQLKDVAKELKGSGMLESFKQQARAQGGKNPCETDGISKAQYACAMGATTTDEWKKCVE